MTQCEIFLYFPDNESSCDIILYAIPAKLLSSLFSHVYLNSYIRENQLQVYSETNNILSAVTDNTIDSGIILYNDFHEEAISGQSFRDCYILYEFSSSIADAVSVLGENSIALFTTVDFESVISSSLNDSSICLYHKPSLPVCVSNDIKSLIEYPTNFHVADAADCSICHILILHHDNDTRPAQCGASMTSVLRRSRKLFELDDEMLLAADAWTLLQDMDGGQHEAYDDIEIRVIDYSIASGWRIDVMTLDELDYVDIDI